MRTCLLKRIVASIILGVLTSNIWAQETQEPNKQTKELSGSQTITGIVSVTSDKDGKITAVTVTTKEKIAYQVVMDAKGINLGEKMAGKTVKATGEAETKDNIKWLTVKTYSEIGSASMMPKAKISFTGQEIRGDEKTGLIVIPSKKMPFITVHSPYHKFIFLLPYSESWELESGTDVPLYARDNNYIVSVNIGTSPANSPREYYEWFLENLKKSGQYLTQNVAVSNIPNSDKVFLRYQVKLAAPAEEYQHVNKWTWNYWMAAPYGSKWYALHLSVLDKRQEELPAEEKKILFALKSFSPGNLDKNN
jgi:hypothetical protein